MLKKRQHAACYGLPALVTADGLFRMLLVVFLYHLAGCPAAAVMAPTGRFDKIEEGVLP